MDDLVPRVIAGSLTYRNGDPMQDGNTAVIKSEDLRALCDRLILYREALEAIDKTTFIGATTDSHETRQVALESAHDIARAVLSRSGF